MGRRPSAPELATYLGVLVAVAVMIASAFIPDSLGAARAALFILSAIALPLVFFMLPAPEVRLWRSLQWRFRRQLLHLSHFRREAFVDLEACLRLMPSNGLWTGPGADAVEVRLLTQEGEHDRGSLAQWWMAGGARKTCFITLVIPSRVTFKHVAILGMLRRLQGAFIEPVVYLSCPVEHRDYRRNPTVLSEMERSFRRLIRLYLAEGAYRILDANHPVLASTEVGEPESERRLVNLLCHSTLGQLRTALKNQRDVTDDTLLLYVFVPVIESLSAFMMGTRGSMVLCGPDLTEFWLWSFDALGLPTESANIVCMPWFSDTLSDAINSAQKANETASLLEARMSDADLLQVLFFLHLSVPAWASRHYLHVGDLGVDECASRIAYGGEADATDKMVAQALRRHIAHTAPQILSALLNRAGVPHEAG